MNPADQAVTQLAAILAKVAPLDVEHVFTVFDEKNLADRVKIGVKTPFVGVIYGGMQSIASADPSRMGRALDMRIGLFFGVASDKIGGVDSQQSAWELLTAARKAIRGQRAPSGHPWRFISEPYLGRRGEVMYYAQHWGTMVAES